MRLNGALLIAAVLGLRSLLVERPIPALEFAIPLAVVGLSGSCVKLECAGLSDLDALEFFCLPHIRQKDVLGVLAILVTNHEESLPPYASR